MPNGTWHNVRRGDDLMKLAGLYYGDEANWLPIFYANEDLYGENLDKVPIGTDVFIPDIETREDTVALSTEYKRQSISPPPRTLWEVRGKPGYYIKIVQDDNGNKKMMFVYPPEGHIIINGTNYDVPSSVISAGLLGVEYAAERLGVESSRISNAMGDDVQCVFIESTGISVYEYGEPVSKIADTLSDAPPTKRATATRQALPTELLDYMPGVPGLLVDLPDDDYPNGVVPDLVRLACLTHYGYYYMYFEALVNNGLNEVSVTIPGQRIKMPQRGKGNLVKEAAKWRERIADD
jgi:hypothetical protein